MAAAVTTTGADFLKSDPVDGNLRRINSSSEETAVDLDEDTAIASEDENTKDLQVSINGRAVIRPKIIDLDNPTEDRTSQTSPTFDLSPRFLLAQAVDTATFMSMMLYLGKLASNVPSAVAAGQSGVWPTLFVMAKTLNYSSQILDHIWRISTAIIPKRSSSPRLRLQETDVNMIPKVDIIITTYNEHVDNVVDTVAAAAAIDYPQDGFRVIVSDDGKDSQLEASVQELTNRYPNILYFARDKKNRPLGQKSHGSKAGNVNDCIHHTANVGGISAKYLLCLDADMIPSRDILRALVAHAEGNENVGMVTLPQSFYNLPINDPIHQTMLPHSEADEVTRDRLDAAWCPGSGFLVDAEALRNLGGFPETSIAEDVLFSWVMQGHGYKTIYVHEKLQHGLQPNSLASHIGQRIKWCVGHVNNSLELNFCVHQPRTAGMGWIQWIAAFLYCVKPWTAIAKFASWIMLAAALYSGKPFVAAASHEDMLSILQYQLCFWMMTRLNEWVLSRPYGYWNLRRQSDFNIWMSPYLTRAIFWELWPNRWGGHSLGFTSTGSMRAAVDERNGATRGVWYRRLVRMNHDTGLFLHVVFFIALVYFICRNICFATDPMELLSTALFPGLGFEQLSAWLSLFLYALNPPTDTPRRALMVQDEYGVWRATKEARGGHWTSRIGLLEVPQTIGTAWTIASIYWFKSTM